MTKKHTMDVEHDRVFPLRKIVSGGQTGVDRAALDLSLYLGISIGGWCPKGRLAEDGPIPPSYPLKETPSSKASQRTEWNVRDADGTLILTDRSATGGTALTIRFAKQHQKPFLIVRLDKNPDEEVALNWITQHHIQTLNVAGPRASTDPRIYQMAYGFLQELLQRRGAPPCP